MKELAPKFQADLKELKAKHSEKSLGDVNVGMV